MLSAAPYNNLVDGKALSITPLLVKSPEFLGTNNFSIAELMVLAVLFAWTTKSGSSIMESTSPTGKCRSTLSMYSAIDLMRSQYA